MGSRRRTVSTADRREIEVLTAGDPSGYGWLWIPGSPSAAADYPRLADVASQLGLRLVTWSRPGYGASSPRASSAQGPRVVDDVPDIETIVEAEGIEEFIVVGWSGGGPRALACAAMLPELCTAAATLAGLAPFDAEGLDWSSGMGPGNVADFAAAREGAEVYAAFKKTYFLPMTAASVDDVAAGLAMLRTPSDDVTLSAGLAAWLTEMTHRAGAQGVIGARDDGLALVAPWGFDVRSIAVPVAIWAGRQDATVPFAHGRWLAANVPTAVPHLLEDAGHLTLIEDLEDVLRELLEIK
jgi:pimeloyl-ACP methyl ester carboxylesterase